MQAAGAKLTIVPPDTKNFQIDFDALEARLNIHTKGVIINSPNNPSGAVYSEQTIQKLAELLTKKSKEFGTHIFIITDEPYREIVYDGVEVPYVTKYYNDTLVCYSYSKSLSLPGERIGFVLVPDEAYESREVYAAICGAGRALGYVCAPSLFQKMLVKCIGNTGDVIHIKMIKRQTTVFVHLHDRKGWAVYRLCDAKPCCKPLCKNGFAYAKISGQCIDLTCLCIFTDFFSEFKCFFFAVCLYNHNFTFFLGIFFCTKVTSVSYCSPMASFGRTNAFLFPE